MAIAPVGLLVIRAWVQEGSEWPLRVEIRLTADTGRGFERELTLREPESVDEVVRTWLAWKNGSTPMTRSASLVGF